MIISPPGHHYLFSFTKRDATFFPDWQSDMLRQHEISVEYANQGGVISAAYHFKHSPRIGTLKEEASNLASAVTAVRYLWEACACLLARELTNTKRYIHSSTTTTIVPSDSLCTCSPHMESHN